jgi:hypothetical protein
VDDQHPNGRATAVQLAEVQIEKGPLRGPFQ